MFEIAKAFTGPKWKTSDYRDLLCLLFLLTKTMKMKGMIALEAHIEKPHEIGDFQALSEESRRIISRSISSATRCA